MKARRRSEDNPNTRKSNDYFILFEKSVDYKSRRFHRLFAWRKRDSSRPPLTDYLPGLKRVRRNLLRRTRSLNLKPSSSCFHSHGGRFARSPSAHWTLISTRRFFARPSLVLL